MTNERNNWENKPSTATPITAENLNKLESNAKKGADFADLATPVGKIVLTSPDGLAVRAAIGAASSVHSHDVATSLTNGFMFSLDKAKLDTIVASDVLPLANGTAKRGDSLAYAREDHVHAGMGSATTTVDGLMTAADKVKLNGIATGATNLKIGTTATDAKAGNWTPPNASYNSYGLVKIGNETPQTAAMNVVTLTEGRTYAVQFDQQGHAVVNVPWVSTAEMATIQKAGVVNKATGVEDSDAEELATLRSHFNELLSVLRTAGIMQ